MTGGAGRDASGDAITVRGAEPRHLFAMMSENLDMTRTGGVAQWI